MDRLTTQQRQSIRSLLQDGRFSAVEELKRNVLNEIINEDIKAEDEFNTLWRVAQREAKVQVLDDFFNRMVKEASEE